MDTRWRPERTVAAARAALAFGVTDGFRPLRVSHDGHDLVLVFRWRRDPNTYAMRFPLPGPESDGPWTGLPIGSPENWAHELSGMLMEELDTGIVRRARRSTDGDVVELDVDDAAGTSVPGYYLSRVPLGPDPGWWLAKHGLDITLPRRGHAEHRLVSWSQACTDTLSPEPAGHASVCWQPGTPGTASLDVLRILPGVPDALAIELARASVHNAADAGVRWVITTLEHPALTEAGFRVAHGSLRADTTRIGLAHS